MVVLKQGLVKAKQTWKGSLRRKFKKVKTELPQKDQEVESLRKETRDLREQLRGNVKTDDNDHRDIVAIRILFVITIVRPYA